MMRPKWKTPGVGKILIVAHHDGLLGLGPAKDLGIGSAG